MRLADVLGQFSVTEIAERLGVTPQAANNRIKALLRTGALSRQRSDPARGGREYLYRVPRAAD
jgi:predicted transcriptional regulator